MSEASANGSARSPLRWVLLVSLVLNIALGAALVLPWLAPGHYGRHHHAGSHGGQHAASRGGHKSDLPSPWTVRRVLGEPRAQVVEEVMERHRDTLRASFRPLREARADARAALVAQPFDRAALEQAFAELRDRDAATAAVVQAMLADLMAQLTAEERQRVVDALPERERKRRNSSSR